MIHRQLGNRRGVRGAASFACAGIFGFLIGAMSRPANAGEFDRSALPVAAGTARCDSGGEAVFKDSGDCKRISGYIAAGAGFGAEQIGGRLHRFGPLDAPEFVGGMRPSGAAVIDAPAGQDRYFLPPGPGDEAR